MTTAMHSPFSYVYDPSGSELRKALLRPGCDVLEPPTVEPLRLDSAQLLIGAGAGLHSWAASLASPSAEGGPT